MYQRKCVCRCCIFCKIRAWLRRLDSRIEQVAERVTEITNGTLPVDTQAMFVREEYPQGTYTEVPASESFTIRGLNTVQYNTIDGASLVNRIIVLPPGTYYFSGRAPAYAASYTRLYLATPPAPYVEHIVGPNANSASTQIDTTVDGFVTFTEETGVCLLHYVYIGGSADRFGRLMTDGNIEVYSSLAIWKLA